MKFVIQRVNSASVKVDGNVIAYIMAVKITLIKK